MRFIVTRPREDSAKLIKKLERAGHSALSEPMICIKALSGVTLPEKQWQAILVTSANSIRALMCFAEGADLTAVPVLAVGPASAHAANEAGFESVISAQGDLNALTKLAARQLDPSQGPVFYPSGTTISGDLKARLEQEGFTCVRLPLYEAVPAGGLSPEAIAGIGNQSFDGVFLYSPRSARTWAKCLAAAGLSQAASSLTHYCLSTAVADALNTERSNGTPFTNLTISPEPNEDSLLGSIGAN